MAKISDTQIANRNFLAPVGFKFSLSKFPKVDFFCNSARIPEITLGTAIQPSYLKEIDIPGEKLIYGDLSLVLDFQKHHNSLLIKQPIEMV